MHELMFSVNGQCKSDNLKSKQVHTYEHTNSIWLIGLLDTTNTWIYLLSCFTLSTQTTKPVPSQSFKLLLNFHLLYIVIAFLKVTVILCRI